MWNEARWIACLVVSVVLFVAVGLQGQAFPPILDALALDGTDGFALWGINGADDAGEVGAGTDLDGDGVNEIFVGAPGASYQALFEGELYVLYGSQSPFPPVVQLGNIDQGKGLIIRGFDDDAATAGDSLAGVGDVNGDGMNDFLFGVPGSDRPGAGSDGQAYLVYGRVGLEGFFPLENFTGSHGVAFNGETDDHEAGDQVAALGDINGDGLADLGIGASMGFVSHGFAYAIFGSTSFPAVVPLETIGGTSGFSFQGTGDDGAYRIAHAGDLNQDGLDDVLIGAWNADGVFAEPCVDLEVNVDDQGIAFLNGNQISGTMTNPMCDPETDPTCYDQQDAGVDRTDIEGRPILTWPTMESISECGPALFQAGENELVFGVAGDASSFEPTGLEFHGTVSIAACLADTGLRGFAGASTIVCPPVSVLESAYESDEGIRVFAEQQGVLLATEVPIDISEPGLYDSERSLTPGAIAVGTRVSSYFVHFDPIGITGNVTLVGSLTLSEDVIGIAALSQSLDMTDNALGAPETIYPDGTMLDFGQDTITLSEDRRTVDFQLTAGNASDDLRIITAVP